MPRDRVGMASLWLFGLLRGISNASRLSVTRAGLFDEQELETAEGPDSGRRCYEVIHIMRDTSPGNQNEVPPWHDFLDANPLEDVSYLDYVWMQETRRRQMCKGKFWDVNMCPEPCPDGFDCYVKKFSVGQPSCLEVDDQLEIRPVSTHQGRNARNDPNSYFVHEEPYTFRPVELPEARRRSTDEDPCPISPGIYRSAKCDNRRDEQMQGINFFEIPPGKGMCADKQCYHADDLATIARRAYDGLVVFKVPHSNRDRLEPYEVRELGLDRKRSGSLFLRSSNKCQRVSRLKLLLELRPLSPECTGPMASLHTLKVDSGESLA